jgi:hypothetical protein
MSNLSTSGADRVNSVLDYLGGNAVLLPIPSGQKFPDKVKDVGWNAYGEAQMSDPAYLARFNNGGNIGVLQGKPSGGLCSIDIDEDELIEEFLKENPSLRMTLRTKRLRGCNFWVWVKGEYPRLKPFHHARLLNDKKKPRQIGEWRSTGGQTVIEGQAEGREYFKVITAKPVEIHFSDIVWLLWIQDPPTLDEPFQHEAKSAGSLDMAKLENVKEYSSGVIKAACPACREDGEDGSGNHLQIKPDGRFGCCKYQDDRKHRQRIWALAGIPKPKTGDSDPFYQNSKEKGPELPEIIDSAIFSAKEIRPSPEIIKGLLHKGAKMVIGGGSKSFKTWVQLDCAFSVAYSIPWLGFPTLPGKVLFVNFEIQEEFFQQRIKKICEARGIVLEEGRLDVWNLRGKSASYHLIIPQIMERIKDSNYVLCILDPVYKLYGKTDENSASDVAQLLNAFEGLTVDTGSAVGFGAHYSKGNQAAKESIDRVSGSGVFARDPDSIIMFTKHEEKDAFTVEPILRNLPPVEPFVVRWKFPLMVRDDELDPDLLKQPGGGRKKEYDPKLLLGYIRLHTHENPVSISKWAEMAGIKRQTLADYLPSLRAKGWIQTVGSGTNSRQSITPDGLHASTPP